VWRDYNLVPFSARLPDVPHPEQAVVTWILNQTGRETWHGEDVAVLSATRARIRVYHHAGVQQQVQEIVERFTRPIQPQVSMRIQFVTSQDVNWRSGLAHLLKPVAYGPDGQQVWLIAPEDASLIRNRLQLHRPSGPLSQQVMAQNGQPNSIETSRPVNYISGLDLAGGAYLSYQPVIGKLNEGVKLVFTPLWTKDGSAVDLDMRLVTRVIQKLHYAQGAAPLSSGNQESLLQVPESVSTSMEQTLRWPCSQVLLISAGMQPAGSSVKRRGPFNMLPAVSELLVIAELDTPFSGRAGASRGGTQPGYR
jgi:hypothetical protein